MAPITAIEFTDTECKVVQADRGKNKPTIKSAFSFALPKIEDAALRVQDWSTLLKNELKSHKVKAQKVTIVIPKHYVMSRLVTLPSTEENELVGMARFEAERHIPFNAERHIVSHSVLSKQGMSGSQVLLAAVDLPIAQDFLDVCLKAGLQVEEVTVSSVSLFNAIAFAFPESMKEKVIAFANIGLTHTDIAIIHNGIMAFSRSATVGVQKLLNEITEAEPERPFDLEKLLQVDALEPHKYFHVPGASGYDPVDVAIPSPPMPPMALDSSVNLPSAGTESGIFSAEQAIAQTSVTTSPDNPAFTPSVQRMLFTNWLIKILGEVKKTYEYARREFNVPAVDQLYLSGEGAAIRNLSQFFTVNFNIPATVFSPVLYFDVPAKLTKDMEKLGPAVASTLGVTVPSGVHGININLLPTEYVEKKQSKRQQQSYLTTGVLAFTALILAYVYVSDLFQKRDDELKELTSKNEQMQTSVADLEAKETRLRIIEQYVKDRHGALDVLEQISAFPFIPDKVTLKSFSYEKEKSVKLSGYAKAVADINQLESALRGTGFFQEVAQESSSQKLTKLPGRGNEQVYEYIITATFPKREVKKKSTPSNEEETDGDE